MCIINIAEHILRAWLLCEMIAGAHLPGSGSKYDIQISRPAGASFDWVEGWDEDGQRFTLLLCIYYFVVSYIIIIYIISCMLCGVSMGKRGYPSGICVFNGNSTQNINQLIHQFHQFMHHS